jgi:glycine betaine catabolism B
VPTSSLATDTRPVFDASFARWFAGLCGVVPALLLLWDAQHGQLGVNGINYAIRTTGLLGLIFLVGGLIVTPLRRLTGWSTLIAARRALGLLGFGYIALHFAIYVWWDRDGSLRSTLDEILERRYLQLGFAALVLMVPLAITSTDAMVRRLGGRRWKLLHRLAYAVAILGVLHYYLLVKADTSQPRLFAIVLGASLAFRLGAHYLDLRRAAAKGARTAAPPPPAKPRAWSGELRVARVFDETADVRTFRLVPVDGGPVPFTHQPGQYLTLSLDVDGRRASRSYTIASPPSRNGYVEISVKRVADGRVSPHVHAQLREGTTVKVSAPGGRFYFSGAGVDRVLLLAGGVGITPIMAMARDLTDRGWPGRIHLVFSVRTPADIIFADELTHLARRFPNLRLCLVATQADDTWTGARGHVNADLLRREVPDLATTPVYLCGPQPMMDAMTTLLRGLGVPADAIHTEAFAPAPEATAAEPTMLAAPAARASADRPVAIRFQRAGRHAEVSDDRTVLEAGEACGLDLPFECRAGVCGQCKLRVVSGQVDHGDAQALSAADRARGLILTCQARPLTDVVIDA